MIASTLGASPVRFHSGCKTRETTVSDESFDFQKPCRRDGLTRALGFVNLPAVCKSSCRSRNIKKAPSGGTRLHIYILETPALCPEWDDSVPSPVLTPFRTCGYPNAPIHTYWKPSIFAPEGDDSVLSPVLPPFRIRGCRSH